MFRKCLNGEKKKCVDGEKEVFPQLLYGEKKGVSVQQFCSYCGIRYPINSMEEPSARTIYFPKGTREGGK